MCFLLASSIKRKPGRVHANGVWGTSSKRGGGEQCGTAAVRNQRTRPAQQVLADAGEQEAVGGDPAGRFEHGECAMNEAGRWCGLGQSGQRRAQRLGLSSEAAHPKLAPLVRRGGGNEVARVFSNTSRAMRNIAITVMLERK